MKTTPCGLFTFADTDSYNYRDAVNNFERSDKLLAVLGGHSSRYFDYDGPGTIPTVGAVVDPRWTIEAFRLYGKGEWVYIYVRAVAKEVISRSGAKAVISLPSFYSAMHTQKLRSLAVGRGAGGWISSAGVVNVGNTSGSDTNIAIGENIQLAGWYLPSNNLTTVGIPTTGEKTAFHTNYVESMNVIDNSAKGLNLNKTVDAIDKTLTISGGFAKDGTVSVFQAHSDTNLHSVRVQRVGDFGFLAITASFKTSKSISVKGEVNGATIGELLAGTAYSSWLYAQPFENDNTGRVIYPYITQEGSVGIGAIGRASGTGSITLPAGEQVSMAGYYRLTGT